MIASMIMLMIGLASPIGMPIPAHAATADVGDRVLYWNDVLLEAFRRVQLDFSARKVRFQLRRCGTVAVPISSSPTSTLTRLSSSGDNSACGI